VAFLYHWVLRKDRPARRAGGSGGDSEALANNHTHNPFTPLQAARGQGHGL
jgi:hypothetical protein